MRKIALFLALITLCSTLASCSAGLDPVPDATKPTTTTKKKVEKKTEETQEEAIMQDYDPAEDDVINVLMIGNSFCYYYVEELYGIAKAAGVNMKVCNLYYSGCKLSQHWTWWKEGQSNYHYFETDERGRKKYESFSLKKGLSQENWDVISFQQSSAQMREDIEAARKNAYKYLTDLLDYTKEQFPLSKIYWHHTWSYQVGYDRSGFVVDSVAKQTEMTGWIKTFTLELCEKYSLPRIPSGDAWHYARKDSRVGDKLCNRGDKSDNYHDGEEGGGQYLNACVWFETITGKSCIGNDWRPKNYKLSESQITGLQQAAHRAVAESRG